MANTFGFGNEPLLHAIGDLMAEWDDWEVKLD